MEELLSQMTNRRDFLKKGGAAAGLIALSGLPFSAFANEEIVQLTILHTNDVHSRIDPFPMDGSRNQGMGGVARRAALVSQIRKEQKNVLLLDAGDVFMGTPYFNMFGGELEFKLMSDMGYDASTIGNHDLDNGIEGFVKQLPHAKFPFLVSNYEMSNTDLKGKTQPYKIFKKQGIKIGVFGLGIELAGLVDKKNYGDLVYQDPIAKANEMAAMLKNEKKCDLIVCLSHLGYKYKEEKVSDLVLAKSTRNIDLIIGGHTHTFLKLPEDVVNLGGTITTINQVGFAGINLGRLDYFFDRSSGKKKMVAAVCPVDGRCIV
ncbi:twin-arginine translocation signal domain-containing protein [Dyadobacter psychrotolerans]|uniref:Twin-arginine translocation signal domain-containing protein n=2 Tax=Dyadobacter psychrotolerans TaxID=2541721 RepID=A0A4R5DT51_9BACT|nr:metallophosphoesterase [Dyadobacter psychrotolerans]TDE15450.1 twin-arginine translocation signal domain-containing protein [Dyadobacter psychrotolerans]